MNLHITTEINLFKIGGIATVLDLLHLHSKKSSFLLVYNGEDNLGLELPPRIDQVPLAYMIEKINSCNHSKHYDCLIFHNYLLANEWVEKGELDVTAFYVMHSNLVLEKSYKGNNLTDEDIRKFFNIISNMNVIVVSHYEKTLLEKICINNNISHKNIQVIHNGYPFDEITNDSAPYLLCHQYGYIGRIDSRKGLLNLYHYWQGINRLLLVAGGGIGKYSHHFLSELTHFQNKNIVHLGHCGEERKSAFYETIDALIIPSFYEPFGMIVLEALTHNKLVLCNKTGGLLEILGESYPFYFDIGDKNSLFDCIYRFESSTDLSSVLNQTKERVKHRFAVQQMIDNYESLK